MYKYLAALSLCLATSILAQPAASQPTPAIASSAWNLVFRFQDPQRLAVVLPGQAEPVVYWYMLYTVENPTDREIDFYPDFTIVPNTLKVIKAERQVSPAAFQAVHRRANDPALLPAEKIAGRLLRGKDRARHGVAIWQDFDPQVKSFTVYVGGLSGEVARWKNPAFDADKPVDPKNQRYFLLRKTLAIPYAMSNRVPHRNADKQTWVMR